MGGTFSYNQSIGAVLAAGSQTLTVTFTPTDAVTYATATATVSLVVNKANASVTLGALSQTYDGATKSVTAATTPAGLATVITYNGGATLPIAAGSYTVIATVTDPNYTGSGSATLTLAKGTPVITWATPAPVTVGTSLSNSQLNASATVGGTFVYTPLAGTVMSSAGTQSLGATFTPTDSANYNGVTATVSLSVTAGIAPRTNVALATNGGVATASSTINATTYPTAALNDGDRIGAKWGAGGGWNDATNNVYPDWAQITFNGQKTINEIDLFTVQDALTLAVTPTSTMTFTKYGITSFDVQYWDGTTWVTLQSVANNLVWRTITFPAVTTDRIRVQVNASLGGYSRIVEIEAYGTDSVIIAANPPTVGSIAPVSTVQGVTTSITITGTNLTGATVTYGNGTVGTATTATATSLVVPITGTTVGAGTVTVTTAGGSATGSLAVTTPAPTVGSIAPVSTVQGVTTSITIIGTNLTGATVTYGNGTVGTATTATATSVIIPITGTTLGAGIVTVTTAGGSATGNLAVTAPAPTVSSIAPVSTVQGVTTSITITGTNLTGATVTYGNGTVGTATTATATSVIIPITGTTLGAGIVTVTTAGGSATGNLAVTAVTTRTNVALATNGGVATASSTINATTYPTAALNDGDRIGAKWGAGGGWNDATNNVYPDWAQITFNGQKTINEIDLFTVQDALTLAVTPTSTMTFTKYGITSFDVQYWDGTTWVTLQSVANNLVWRAITFPAVTTDRIRVQVNASLGGYSRIVEIEAYGTAAMVVTPQPTVSSIAPTSTVQGVVTSVTITGTNLTGAIVTYGNGTVGTATIATATSLVIPITGTTVGTGTITVTTAGGSATGNLAVTAPVTPAPTVGSVSPGSIVQGVVTTVSITGTNLTGATVTYGNGTVGTATIATATSMVIPITGTTVGAGTVTVTTAGGSATGNLAVTAPVTPAPTVGSVSPGSIVQGVVTTVSITGTNLTGATVTYGNGTVGTATIATATSMVIPITGTTVGAGTVTVTTAGGSATGNLAVTAVTTRTNVALATNGGVATASSTINATTYPTAALNDGDRIGAKWGAGGGWNDATNNVYPDWAQITFNGQKTINEIDLFTVQDALTLAVTPTSTMTFTKYGITSFDVQYWDGTTWVTLQSVANNLVWRAITFPAVTTDRIRIQVNASLGGYSRIVEIEAYGTAAMVVTPQPTVTSISPTSAVQGVATSVTITGTNLTGATVTYGNGTVGSATIATATSMIIPITGTTVGAGIVTVTTAGGSATGNLAVTAAVTPAPTVTSISPTSAVQGVATSVTITGTNLTGATVTYGNGTVGTATTATATSLVIPITGTTVGVGTITVTTAGGSATGSLAVTAATTRINVALATNGGVASASSYLITNPPSKVIDGNRATGNGFWRDTSANSWPDWIQITFNGQKTISEIDIFTAQDILTDTTQPTAATTFTVNGITAFDVQYWNGTTWVTLQSVANSNLVWQKITFPAVTTNQIRVTVNASLASYSRIVEIEAY